MREGIREIHDLTGNVAAHYREKYGDQAEVVLEDAARLCEENGDLYRRNRLLRLRDELLFCDMTDVTEQERTLEPRLKAELWVKAHIRKCAALNIPVMVARRGDDTAGSVLLKINRLGPGCMVLSPTTNFDDGARMWLKGTGPDWVEEAEADAYIERRVKNDPDLWVLEIEDREGRAFLDEKIE